MTDICEEPHETIEEEDACEAARTSAKPAPKPFVGKHVVLRSTDGFQYEGYVTDTKSDGFLWLQLDHEWWVNVHHVSAAMWGESDDS